MLASAIMQYEDVDFKTLSDRMVPFLAHIDGVIVNLFSINPRKKTKTNKHYG